MSTFSPSLRIELITTGDQAGVWGNTTNTNLGTLVESAIAGYVSVSVTAADQALTAVNGAEDQSRNQVIALTTTTVAAFNVYAPPAEKTYTIYNASAYAATLYNSTVLGNTTAAGAGAIIPAGKTVTLWSDGTNFVFQNNHLTNLTLATDLAIADGGTGASTAANARTNLGLVIGTDVPSPTGTGSSGTWPININGNASNATIAASALTANNVTGIVAVANGGTGASTAANARTNLGLVIGTNVPSPTGTGASGTWGINITGNAASATSATTAGSATTASSATFATTAGSANAVAWANVSSKPFSYSGQSGQPTWLWGTNDGATYYVWNPSNFSVNFATSATYATSATNAITATNPASGGTFITSLNIASQTVYYSDFASTAQYVNNVLPAQVLNITAAASLGAVGTYAFLGETALTTTSAGGTRAGSFLRYVGAQRQNNGWQNTNVSTLSSVQGPSTPAGTWRAMGHNFSGTAACTTLYGATLWLRIS